MESAIKPQSTGTKQLFKSQVLERLSRTHISVPIIIFCAYSYSLLYWSFTHTSLSVGASLGAFALGFIFFTWVEYQVHRHLFHMSTFNLWRKNTQYLIHGVHHEFPKDKGRLAMPPLVSVVISTLLLLICRWLMGDLAFSFFPGFLVGYSYYLLIHYMVHAFPPPGNFLKVLWVNHSIHHYKDGDGVFGVSSPFWDYVYGTLKK